MDRVIMKLTKVDTVMSTIMIFLDEKEKLRLNRINKRFYSDIIPNALQEIPIAFFMLKTDGMNTSKSMVGGTPDHAKKMLSKI